MNVKINDSDQLSPEGLTKELSEKTAGCKLNPLRFD